MSGPPRVVLVPGVLALLPEYAGLEDPVADLRAACLEAVGWLGDDVTVLADAQGHRVADALLSAHRVSRQAPGRLPQPTESVVEEVAQQPSRNPVTGPAYLVVANGSACRGEKAPGHLDERSFAFDESLRRALCGPDSEALASLDETLGDELLAGPVSALRALGGVLTSGHRVSVDYDDDPFGVQYWVMRWQCES